MENKSDKSVTVQFYEHELVIEPKKIFRKAFRGSADGSYVVINPETKETLANIGYFSHMMGTCHKIIVTSGQEGFIVSEEEC